MKLEHSNMIICLVSPSAGGKTTVASKIIDSDPNILKFITHTSRAPRAEEVDRQDYYFVSRSEFIKLKETQEFFETEEIHGNFYGSSSKLLKQALGQGKDLLMLIDIKGALNFKSKYPNNTIIIFLAPPSFEEMRDRLEKRGDLKDSIKQRIATAKHEYKLLQDLNTVKKVDYFLVNSSLEDTFEQIIAIINAERSRTTRLVDSEISKIIGVI